MLVVTHERHVAERADRIIHLLDGKIERIEASKESGESRAGPTTDRGSGREEGETAEATPNEPAREPPSRVAVDPRPSAPARR